MKGPVRPRHEPLAARAGWHTLHQVRQSRHGIESSAFWGSLTGAQDRLKAVMAVLHQRSLWLGGLLPSFTALRRPRVIEGAVVGRMKVPTSPGTCQQILNFYYVLSADPESILTACSSTLRCHLGVSQTALHSPPSETRFIHRPLQLEN